MLWGIAGKNTERALGAWFAKAECEQEMTRRATPEAQKASVYFVCLPENIHPSGQHLFLAIYRGVYEISKW